MIHDEYSARKGHAFITYLSFGDAMFGQFDDGEIAAAYGPLDVIETYSNGIATSSTRRGGKELSSSATATSTVATEARARATGWRHCYSAERLLHLHHFVTSFITVRNNSRIAYDCQVYDEAEPNGTDTFQGITCYASLLFLKTTTTTTAEQRRTTGLIHTTVKSRLRAFPRAADLSDFFFSSLLLSLLLHFGG